MLIYSASCPPSLQAPIVTPLLVLVASSALSVIVNAWFWLAVPSCPAPGELPVPHATAVTARGAKSAIRGPTRVIDRTFRLISLPGAGVLAPAEPFPFSRTLAPTGAGTRRGP